jgi:hypothetical protein
MASLDLAAHATHRGKTDIRRHYANALRDE